MKKLLCLMLVLLLAMSAALAAPQLSDSLFDAAKRAAQWLANGDYDALAQRMPFSGTAPDADEWSAFASSYRTSGEVQQRYAVGYWRSGGRSVAVPLREPSSPDVEVLVLASEDGFSFSGYRFATWAQVAQEYAASEHVVWNAEYVPGAPQLFAD